jgi:hypothetical protein
MQLCFWIFSWLVPTSTVYFCEVPLTNCCLCLVRQIRANQKTRRRQLSGEAFFYCVCHLSISIYIYCVLTFVQYVLYTHCCRYRTVYLPSKLHSTSTTTRQQLQQASKQQKQTSKQTSNKRRWVCSYSTTIV